jgi:hypothetical protein
VEENIYLIRDLMASNSMLWELTKNYSSFLVKRRECAAMFSTDPFNLTNEHCAKQGGKILM